MASKCITGKLTEFTKFKSRGPNIYKMSGQMYHLIPNLFPVKGKNLSSAKSMYMIMNVRKMNWMKELNMSRKMTGRVLKEEL